MPSGKQGKPPRAIRQTGTLRYQGLPDEDDNADFFKQFTVSRATSVSALGALDGASLSFRETEDALRKLRKMGEFESMDYDPMDNDVQRQTQVHKEYPDYSREEVAKWLISGVIGITMGIMAFFVDWGIEALNTAKYNNTLNVLQNHGDSFWAPYFSFVGLALLYGLFAGAIVSYVEPLASGSGIPEMKTYLNGVHLKGLMQMKTLLAKLGGVMFSISSGLIAGKEGPFVHGGGIVGGGLGGMGSMTLSKIFGRDVKVKRKYGGFFRNDADHRDFTAIGTAAGVATAFAAPIGGLLFTIEEGASFYSTSMLWRGFLSTCMGVLTLHFLVEFKNAPEQAIHNARFGLHRDFGLYSDSRALYGRKFYYYIWELPTFMVLGGVCGLLGALFIWLNVKITKWRHAWVPVRNPHKRVLEVLLVVLVTSSAAFVLCYTSPCETIPPSESDGQRLSCLDRDIDVDVEADVEDFYQGGGEIVYYPQLWCKDGEYSILGQVFYAPISQALRLIIHLGEPNPMKDPIYELPLLTLSCYFLFAYVLMVWTYGVGAATGLFVPSLTSGACVGRLTGRLMKVLLTWLGSSQRLSLQSYAVIGAAACLGGATRMTISICVLVMETTGSLQLIVPIMVTVVIAKAVGDSFGLGIYDTHIEIRGAPVLEEDNLDYHQRMVHEKLAVKDLMSDRLACLPPVVKLMDLANILRESCHGAFPITSDAVVGGLTEEPIGLEGVVTRTQLLRMVKYRIGFVEKDTEGGFPSSKSQVPAMQDQRLTLLEQLQQVPLKVRPKEEQDAILRGLSDEELNSSYMDLRPFMQKQPFCIQANAGLPRAYRLFRNLGLRHVFVVPSQPRVIGMITRKDVIKDNAKLVLGEKFNRGLDSNPGAEDCIKPRALPFLPFQNMDAESAGDGEGSGSTSGRDDEERGQLLGNQLSRRRMTNGNIEMVSQI